MKVDIGIDPGVNDFSIAILRGEILQYATFVSGRATELSRILARWDCARIVIERPQAYSLHNQKGDQQDIMDLSWSAGALEAACILNTTAVVTKRFPREWKGQITKDVTKVRVTQELTDAEKLRISWPAARLRHNVYDAIHLALRTWSTRKV